MDLESILNTIQPFIVMFAALLAAFLTATWIGAVIWAFRDIRSRSRDIFAQVLATLMVLVFFPLFPVPGLLLYLILRPRETLSEIYERSLEEEVLLQGIEERMACPGCNRRIEDAFMICPTCHTRLKKACPSCGQLLHLRWNICPYCGAVQTTAKGSAPSPRAEAPAEAFILHPRPEMAAEPYGSPLGPEMTVEPSGPTLEAEMPAEASAEEETVPPDWIDSPSS